MYIYIDGMKYAEKTFTGPLVANSNKLIFGSNQAENGNFYNGRIDEVKFSSDAKTNFDINNLFSTRGDLWSSPVECLATLEYYADWAWPDNNNEWLYRKKINIKSSKITDYVANFPYLIKITDSDLKTIAQSDGADIMFTASDAKTKLDFEIESYNSATGELLAWVEIPALSSKSNFDNSIFMYFGNSALAIQLR
jgi:hypothetical protein